MALGTDPANGLVYHFGGEWNVRAGVEDPHPLFLAHATLGWRGTQHDVVFGAFKFQGIAGADLQGVAHRFGEDHAAGFIDS